ncbi:MAG: UDP-4-amino-4-deoxy-L-arabinose aminotransferase [Planctomycetota bacterium]|nr:MAG: UDP-4-amino-4-deoxy-L-arabinose aminotransferase [Planctomycetota bacterium]
MRAITGCDFLPFSRPSISQADIDAVSEVLRSGWITTGSRAAAFEQAFCDYVGCRSAVGLSSATAGMHLALKALGVGEGDEVITPSMTWVSTVNLIVLMGAAPVFADVDRDTLMVSGDTIARCITPRTKVIIPVHFAGSAVDMESVMQLARRQNIFVVEDAAHALGAEYRERLIGGSGTSIFSFHPIKNITAGEGGMFCSDDAELLNSVRRLKFHGLGVDAYDRHTQGRSPQAQVQEPGYKYNMTDVSAALGLSQLGRIEEFNSKRTALAMRYQDRLREVDELIELSVPNYPFRHAWHLFIVRLDTDRAGMSRDDFMVKLKARGIGTGLHFFPVHLQKYYRENATTEPGSLVNTEWNAGRILSLPLFPGMTVDDVDRVIDTIKEIL